jgi:hypothetical protein
MWLFMNNVVYKGEEAALMNYNIISYMERPDNTHAEQNERS